MLNVLKSIFILIVLNSFVKEKATYSLKTDFKKQNKQIETSKIK